jgi:hypothetical protein
MILPKSKQGEECPSFFNRAVFAHTQENNAVENPLDTFVQWILEHVPKIRIVLSEILHRD